jgi:hypothetical protein
MKSLTSLIAIGLILASPAFGSGAMAADIHAKANTRHVQVSQHRPAPRVAARSRATGTRYGYGGLSVDPARIINGLLASPWVAPYLAQYGGRMRVTRGSRRAAPSYDSGPSYDPGPSSSPSPDLSPPPAGPDTAGMNTSTNPTWPALQ